MMATEPMNRYVGSANAFDDSATPRRFTAISRITHTSAISTRHMCSCGKRGDEVVDAGRHRHGNREHVVDEQGRRHDEPGVFAQIA